ncbi:MAG: peptidoglycan DD-metalloendopeptidase family protein [Defluviitaleaceae bacterium]|nr:peptidoglycan DD-metalloendopeptidase family protein [Defluviitaleaceae bacterium]
MGNDKNKENKENTEDFRLDKKTDKDISAKESINNVLDSNASLKEKEAPNLQDEKGENLQDDKGAELTKKNRLEEKIEEKTELPTYGNYIKNRKKYNKYAKRVEAAAQPYISPLLDNGDNDEHKDDEKEESKKEISETGDFEEGSPRRESGDIDKDEEPGKFLGVESNAEENNSTAGYAEKGYKGDSLRKKSPIPIKTNADGTTEGTSLSSSNAVLEEPPKKSPESRLQDEKSELKTSNKTLLNTHSPRTISSDKTITEKNEKEEPQKKDRIKASRKKILADAQSENIDTQKEAPKYIENQLRDSRNSAETDNKSVLQSDSLDKLKSLEELAADKKSSPKTQKEFNRKKAHKNASQAQSTAVSSKQDKIADKIEKKVGYGTNLHEKREKNAQKIPTKKITTKERVFDETKGYSENIKSKEDVAVPEREARWNNPGYRTKVKAGLKSSDNLGDKAKVIGKESAVAIAKSPLKVAKTSVSYGSKLVVHRAHARVRQEIREADDEFLKAAHYVEQKVEREISKNAKKLNPVQAYSYIKNTPYRKEGKLQLKELKNNRNIALLRVKQDKQTGTNHMTGEKSNAISRAWQKRKIKKDYAKAYMAAKGGRGSGTMFKDMSREVLRGNYRAIVTVPIKVIAKSLFVLTAKVTVLNPLFWKIAVIFGLFFFLMTAITACMVIFMPMMSAPNVENYEELISYIEYVRELDREVNQEIRYRINANDIYRVGRIVNGVFEYDDTSNELVGGMPQLNTSINHFFALFMVFFDNDWENAYENLRYLHGHTYSLEFLYDIYLEWFDGYEVYYERDIYGNFVYDHMGNRVYSYVYGYFTDEYGNYIYGRLRVEGYVPRTRVMVDLRIFTLEEIIELLNERYITGQSQRYLDETDREIIEDLANSNILIHFPEIGDRGMGEWVFGVSPEEIEEAFDGLQIAWPTNHRGITSPWGPRIIFGQPQFHNGIDIGIGVGTPVFAAMSGVVIESSYNTNGAGNWIRIRSAQGVEIRYLHLGTSRSNSGRLVRAGDTVNIGDQIGWSGSTGRITGPHLCFVVLVNGSSIDPLSVLPGSNNLDNRGLFNVAIANALYSCCSSNENAGNSQQQTVTIIKLKKEMYT